jgi:lysine 2,3-aminomutase
MNDRNPDIAPRKVRYLRSVEQIPELGSREMGELAEVQRTYAFRANDYYMGLIDWDDPDDPIRRLVVPDKAEMQRWGALDPSNEAANTVAPGLQHKYRDTALLLAAPTCAAYCRYCFRKRLFMEDNDETDLDLGPALAYIDRHREIRDVLMTGGDPLVLGTDRLLDIASQAAKVDHVRVVRIGSKTVAFNPFRILEDQSLLDGLAEINRSSGATIYIMAHFDHPRELTRPARAAVKALQEAGCSVVNQCPLVRGVNDDPAVLTELFTTMTSLGAPQYYLFQGRPTAGNKPYTVPIVEGFRIFDAARRRCSGLSRRARYCMSHASGKIEIVGVDRHTITCRYHRARDPEMESRVIVCSRDEGAYWYDDLQPLRAAAAPLDEGAGRRN